MTGRQRLPRWLAGLIGVAILVLVWWVLSVTVYAPEPGTTFTPVPSPFDVISQIVTDGFNPYWSFFKVTITEAPGGSCTATSGPPPRFDRAARTAIEPVVLQIGVVTYCLPIVAVGGICIVVLGGAKRAGDPSATAIFLAAFLVFFTTLVGALVGFRSADKASLDVVATYGGGRFTQLRKVRLIAALPAILNALQIAVPTAFLGAVLGEYMGATDRSVGIMLVRLQGNLDSVRVWAVFLLCAAVALVGYSALGLLARLLTPWMSGSHA